MLQLRTIEPHTLGLLKRLNEEPLLSTTFLVGGTSLALQLGHRFSLDLDLFTHESIETEALLENLEVKFQVQPLSLTRKIFICVLEGVKVDVVHFRYPFSFPIQTVEGIRIADIRDVAPMKLDAVDLTAFLLTLTDKHFLFNPEYSYPKATFMPNR